VLLLLNMLDLLITDILQSVLLPYCDVQSLVRLDEVFLGNTRNRHVWKTRLLPSTWATFSKFKNHSHDSVRWIAERNIPIASLYFSEHRHTLCANTFRGIYFSKLSEVDLTFSVTMLTRRTEVTRILMESGEVTPADVASMETDLELRARIEGRIAEEMNLLSINEKVDMMDHDAILYLVAACHKTLKCLNLRGCTNIGGGSLSFLLAECKLLQRFRMDDVYADSSITEGDMEQFQYCENMEMLFLELNVPFDILCCPALRYLNISNAGDGVFSQEFADIEFLPRHMVELSLTHSAITDTDVGFMVQGWQLLQSIHLWGATELSGHSLRHLLALPLLTELYISCCANIRWDSAAMISPLSVPSNLKHLRMFRCDPFSHDGIQNLIRLCPALVYFQGSLRMFDVDEDIEHVFLSENMITLMIRHLPHLRLLQLEEGPASSYGYESPDEHFQIFLRELNPLIQFCPTPDMSDRIYGETACDEFILSEYIIGGGL
jgi:hypothetical protein